MADGLLPCLLNPGQPVRQQASLISVCPPVLVARSPAAKASTTSNYYIHASSVSWLVASMPQAEQVEQPIMGVTHTQATRQATTCIWQPSLAPHKPKKQPK